MKHYFPSSWTKSFNCPGVVGKDVVGMLNKSLADVGVTNVKVVAIINDTTGTLVAGSHDYPDTAIGLILGTGTNGSYMEKAHRVVRWNLLFLWSFVSNLFEISQMKVGAERGQAKLHH